MTDQRNITPNFNFVELDFNDIRESLKQFLRQQDTLKDIDFEGSNISVLLDLLAHSTQYNAFYHAMASSEAYLDSAVLRNNVVARAKMLSYVPRSKRSSFANITLSFTTDSATYSNYIIPEGTIFSGGTANFQTLEDKTATLVSDNGTTKTWSVDLDIFAGKKVSNTISITNKDRGGVVIPNAGVDTSTLQVFVKDSPTASLEVPYTLYDSLDELTPTANIYFLEEVDDQKFRVYFGNDVIGKTVSPPNVVRLSYVVAETDANGISAFQISSGLVGAENLSLTVNAASSGGRPLETVSEIKLRAPRIHSAQNRAVTAKDYEIITINNFSNVDSVVAWGGEDNDPPMYGFAYLAVKPFTGDTLTQTEKVAIANELKEKYSVVTIQPILVDPDYTYLNVSSVVRYDPRLTSNPESVKTAVVNTINAYSDNNLNKFSKNFRQSTLSSLIDNSNVAITSNVTDVVMEKRLDSVVGIADDITIKFNNKLIPGSMRSGLFDFTRVNVTNTGTLYTSAPTVNFTNKVGKTFTLTVTTDGFLKEETVQGLTSGATGFVVNYDSDAGTIDVVDISGTFTVTETIRGLSSEAEATVDSEVVYNSPGTDMTGIAVLGHGAVGGFTLSVAGSDDHTTATVTIDPPPSGVTAEAEAIIRNGEIVGLLITEEGSGYTSTPAVTVSGDGTTDPTFLAEIPVRADRVHLVNITNQGENYVVAPDVSFSGGGGSGAAATATFYENAFLTSTDGDLFSYEWSGNLIDVVRKNHGLKLGDRVFIHGATHNILDNTETNNPLGYIVKAVTSDTFQVYVNYYWSEDAAPLTGQFGKSSSDGISLIELNRTKLENDQTVESLIDASFATINNSTGNFSLSNFSVQEIVSGNTYLEIEATPILEEVVPVREQILLIDKSATTVTMVSE